jgi:predicted GH43/DUF377 family glycosyl hydrolase
MKVTVKKRKLPIIKNAFATNGNILRWDSLWAYHPIFTKYNEEYYITYTGKKLGRGVQHQIGFAKSKDLKKWEKVKNNPIFTESKKGWDDDFVAHGYIYKEKNIFYMYYDGSKKGDWLEEIGLAKSTDLLHWERYEKNPVFKLGKHWWEKRHVSRCCIFKEKDTYYMFYAGNDGKWERVGIAAGKSLTSFKRLSKDPVLSTGEKGDWDEISISDPRVLKYKGQYLMFYSGIDAKGNERTGLAISKDLLHWEKYDKNPILNISKEGWDSASSSRSDIQVIKEKIYIFYSGRNTKFYSIGMAEIKIT